MNNKGLTLVELITTFALTSVIIVLLINIVLVIKEVYNKSNIKSELYIKQANLSNYMNELINHGSVLSINECTDKNMMMCYDIELINDKTIKLTVKEKEIKVGDFTYKLENKSKVENAELKTITIDNSGILVIKIPIKSDLYSNIDYGINLVYMYDPNKIELNI